MSTDISRILEGGESETTDFKSARTQFDTLTKAVCGMLNQQGGVLLWGVDERGRLTGIDDAEKRAKDLNDYLMKQISPRPLLSVSVHEATKKHVVIVDIPHGADKPYSVNREIWVRIGSKRTLRADEMVSTQIVERSAAEFDRWEREPMPGFGMEDCDPDELGRARFEIAKSGRFGIDVPTEDEELLRCLYLTRNGQLTNAAVVLFARQPRIWAPHMAVRVASFSKDKTGPVGNDIIVEGPAIRVLKQVVGIVQQLTGYSGRFENKKLEREDRPAYALFALREGLVNALVHRDYKSIGGSVQIEIFPDHLVIRNPGQLPDGWTVEDLKKNHTSLPRNPDVARVFYLREMMEQLGMGTQKLISACKELNAKAPVWRTEQGAVALTLFRAPQPEISTPLNDRQEQFLKSIPYGSEFKTGDYLDAVKVSERQSRRDLTEMEAIGFVERLGKGPATHYRRTDKSLP